mmetsp:Transcript_109687/g.163994  ORF Transcript_109687/g.163994 Transcript_109687/m.163994 type:complete len:194 (+) Transcript_109687:24-605(+)
MGLQRARKSIDAKALVEATYDEDDECQDLLVDVMSGMLDKITHSCIERSTTSGNTSTTTSTTTTNNNSSSTHLKTIHTRLQTVDAIIAQIRHQDAATQQHESDDKLTAHESLEEVLLPLGVTLEDVLRYQHYHFRQLEERRQLQEQLQNVRAQVAELQGEVSQEQRSVSEHLTQLKTVAKELGQSADACSMVH